MRYWYFVDFRHGISVFVKFSYGIAVLGTPQCLPGEVIKGGGHVSREKLKIAYYYMNYLILLARVLQIEIDTNTHEVSSSKMQKINTP